MLLILVRYTTNAHHKDRCQEDDRVPQLDSSHMLQTSATAKRIITGMHAQGLLELQYKQRWQEWDRDFPWL